MTQTRSARQSQLGNDLFKGMTKQKKVQESPKKPRQQVTLGEYGRYRIKTGLLAGTFVARAFPRTPDPARGLIAEASGADEEAAIAALHEVIDAREARRVKARRQDALSGQPVPRVEEFVEAIGQVALTAPQRAILTALSLADAEGLSEARLVNAGSYKSRTSARRSFAGAGQAIAAYLASGTDATDPVTGTAGISVLGFQGAPGDDEAPGNWVLHPEMREAVREAL